jgi:hypothetical protein
VVPLPQVSPHNPYTRLSPPHPATCLAYLILLDFITRNNNKISNTTNPLLFNDKYGLHVSAYLSHLQASYSLIQPNYIQVCVRIMGSHNTHADILSSLRLPLTGILAKETLPVLC